MHLKSLTLKGFKSFASATTLKFEPGICAVVGPNGSGKSNVVDALAWVMGEQGAKTLRGGKMEDVIFAGTSGRKPLGRAEVTLTIDNSDGALPIQYQEVSVTRRMFRDGASEYEINGSRCRLMDVQELLSDSGIGREMHIIVGQGRLSQILEARPEERRAFIEEAAGVLKHRRRKEKAQRKLTSMQANLDRLEDLTGELSRQLKPLARQAEAARRAQTVQAQLRDAKLRLAAADYVELEASLADVNQRHRVVAEQLEAAEADLEIAQAQAGELSDQLAEVEPKAEHARELWFQISALSERIQATSRIAADRAQAQAFVPWSGPDPDQLDARAEEAQAEEDELAANQEQAESRLETIRESLAEAIEEANDAEKRHRAQLQAIADRREGLVRLSAAEESLNARLQSAEEEAERLGEFRAEATERRDEAEAIVEEAAEALAENELVLPELTENFAQAEAEQQAAAKRVARLREQQRELDREIARQSARIEALEATRTAAQSDGAGWLQQKYDFAALAEQLQVAQQWRGAIAAALGPLSTAVVATKEVGTATAATSLAEADAGNAVIVDPKLVSGWRLDAQLPAGCQWALDALNCGKSEQSTADQAKESELPLGVVAVLVDVVLADSPETAQTVVTNDQRLRAATADGTLYGAGWIATTARTTAQQNPVALTGAIEQATIARDEATAKLEDLQGTVAGAVSAEEDSRTAVASARAALREKQHEITVYCNNLSRAQTDLAAVVEGSSRSEERLATSLKRVDKLRQELHDVQQRLTLAEDEVPEDHEPSTEQRDRAAETLAQVRAMETEARLALRTAEERFQAVRGKAERLRRQAQMQRQAQAHHQQAQARKERVRLLSTTVSELADGLHGRAEIVAHATAAKREELDSQRKQLSAALQQAQQQSQQAQARTKTLAEAVHNNDIAKAEANVRLGQAQEHITTQLGIAIEDLLASYHPDHPMPDGEPFDRAAVEKTRRQAEKDLRVLGKVNPLALEEYKAMEERYTFLSTQLADVKQARQDLFDVVAEVDATILQLFTDAWRDVEAEFPKVFATLFPGGEGRLVLTEPDDMLTTGIEVEARPPGKKVKRLSLLSGGEKSLTTLAMLVAIFRARPSPFYVLDEVEAALDDVNLRRLINLLRQLRETSQLIVITHQKPTMDEANVLYGVTMAGDGITRVISQRMAPDSERTGGSGE